MHENTTLDELLAEIDAPRLMCFREASSGLRAFLVVDDLTLGPAAGGTRTRAYASAAEAVRDAADLARAMTVKCALAGLEAGGAKMVVMDHPGLVRRQAFATLGRRVQELGGIFYTAGDLGTGQEELEAMAATCSYVRTDLSDLASAVARGVAACIDACARMRGAGGIDGLHVAIQGCGAVGSAVASALASAGARLTVADVHPDAASRVASVTDAAVVEPERILAVEADVLAPCATGRVIDVELARTTPVWAICGAANNLLATPTVGQLLADREILLVPDVISSAGAVIHGFCDFRGESRAPELIDRLGETAREVLEQSLAERRATTEIAEERARARLSGAAG